MTPDIVIGILTRGRLPELRRAATSAIANVGRSAAVVVAFDDAYEPFRFCPNWRWATKVLLKPRHYYVRGMNELYNAMKLQFPEMHYFVISNDDAEWMAPDWGEMAIQTFEKLLPDGKGVLEMADPTSCAHYLSTREFFDEEFGGVLCRLEYTHYYSDSHLRHQLIDQKRYFVAENEDHLPICVHHKTMDSVREEVRYWLPRDGVIYEAHCEANGWKEGQ